MNQGLALFEALQPPPDYKTRAALGTTYSADLVACMVALTSLDASSSEGSDYTRISALRALGRQRDNVRIAVHQGRIAWHGKHRRTLPLLDRIVRPVAFDGNARAFHPKVWLSRQTGPEGSERWVLIIGSRNLTTSQSWDFGITLVGSSMQPNKDKGRSRRLVGLAGFAHRVCELFGEPGFASRFDGINDVFWRLPEGCDDATLHVSPGENAETVLDEAPPLTLMKGAESVLILSPFLDSAMVARAARACRGAGKLRLVAGAADLDKVSLTSARKALTHLKPHFIDVAEEDTMVPPQAGQEVLEERKERGLHAKLVLAQRGERFTLLAGSHNLTSRAWGGANCEVSLALKVDPALAQKLWEWSDVRARAFEAREQPPQEDPSKELDTLRNRLGATRFHLTDSAEGGDSTLRAEAPLRLEVDGLELLVARLSRPDEAVSWPAGAECVVLPACLTAERTSFLILRLRAGDQEVAWVQNVEISPPIDEGRDREAFIRILGIQGFLQYLRMVLGESVGEGEEQDDGPEEPPTPSTRSASRSAQLFRFEDILRRLCRPDSETLHAGPFHEAVAVVRQHRDILMRSELPQEERKTLKQLWDLWDAIEEGMQLS